MPSLLPRRRLAVSLTGLLAAPALRHPALAQGAWKPARPVRIVVPYTPGNITDIAARLLAERIAGPLGQSVMVENRAGAGTVIGTEAVARAEPDGQTLLLTGAPFSTNPALQPSLPYDSARDFAPVALVVTNPLVLVAHPSAPFRSPREMIARAKSHPGTVQIGSGGNGTLPHMATEMLAQMTGAELVHVPYRGGSAATTDTVAGNIPCMFDNPSSCAPHVRAGRLLALGLTSAEPSPAWPEVPTVGSALGLPDFAVTNWFGLLAPGATPPDLLEAIHATFAQALRDPALVKRFQDEGVRTGSLSRAEFGEFVKAETAKWTGIIRERNIKPS